MTCCPLLFEKRDHIKKSTPSREGLILKFKTQTLKLGRAASYNEIYAIMVFGVDLLKYTMYTPFGINMSRDFLLGTEN